MFFQLVGRDRRETEENSSNHATNERRIRCNSTRRNRKKK